MNAKQRLEAVKAAGLMETQISITRNGEAVETLGRLVKRDAEAESKGCYRAPHGAEADALLAAEHLSVGAEIALDRADSNGRNVFWGGGAVSSPSEVRTLGAEAAKAAAVARAARWATANVPGYIPAWAYTVEPGDYDPATGGLRK